MRVVFFWVTFLLILSSQILSVFGLRGKKVEVFEDAKLTKPVAGQTLGSLAGKMLFVSPAASDNISTTPSSVKSPVCHFANVEYGGKKASLLLENPRGSTCTAAELLDQVSWGGFRPVGCCWVYWSVLQNCWIR